MGTHMTGARRGRLLGTIIAVTLGVGCEQAARPGEAPAAAGAENAVPVAKDGAQQRLSVKIAALVKLREELELVLPELGKDAERAASLNALYEALRRRLGASRTEEVVAAVRAGRAAAKAPKEAQAAGAPLHHRERIARLTKAAERLMVAEPRSPDDPQVVDFLKQRLALEQEATAPTLATAHMGAQALNHVDELAQVVAELARIAEAEGIPVKAPTASAHPDEPAPTAAAQPPGNAP